MFKELRFPLLYLAISITIALMGQIWQVAIWTIAMIVTGTGWFGRVKYPETTKMPEVDWAEKLAWWLHYWPNWALHALAAFVIAGYDLKAGIYLGVFAVVHFLGWLWFQNKN